MKPSISLVLFLILILSCEKEPIQTNPSVSTPIPEANTNGTTQAIIVRGTARDSVSGSPLAHIVLTNSHPGFPVWTDSLGNFNTSVMWRIGGKFPIAKPESFYIVSVCDTLVGRSKTIDLQNIHHGDSIEHLTVFLNPR